VLKATDSSAATYDSTADWKSVPTVVIKPTRGWAALNLKEVWHYRELFYFFVWRDLKIRYKQTILGVLWILLQPVVSIVVFSVLFGQLLKVPSNGVPYPVFAYAALLPWNYFSSALLRSTGSLLLNPNLITKIYFPRMIIPVNSVVSNLVDFGISFLVLLALMLAYGIRLTPSIALLPFLTILAMLTATGFGLWLSALNVRFRDVGYLMPFLIQIWMYATPVIYGSSLIPERFRFILGLNPMTVVVEGFRWALLGEVSSAAPISPWTMALSVLMVVVVLISGLIFFRRTERTFADMI
jgi:lipopolysaccharide transport system permease protein